MWKLSKEEGDNVGKGTVVADDQTKCDGVQPQCGSCAVRESECYYDKIPSMNYTLSLGQRVIELERILTIMKAADPQKQQEILQRWPSDMAELIDIETGGAKYSSVVSDSFINHDEMMSEVSVEQDGTRMYYGSTSVLRPPPANAAVMHPEIMDKESSSSSLDAVRLDSTMASSEVVREMLATTDVPKELAENLFRYY